MIVCSYVMVTIAGNESRLSNSLPVEFLYTHSNTESAFAAYFKEVYPVSYNCVHATFIYSTVLPIADTKKSVQFNEEVQVEQFDPNNVRIDESIIDQALDEIQNADPTGLTEDSPEMLNLEGKIFSSK